MVQVQDAVMVVAHPDDEILWFSSILNQCKSVLVCFVSIRDFKRELGRRSSCIDGYISAHQS